MVKKAVRKKIVDKAKKVNKCPYCKELNGTVKKATSSMKSGTTGGSVLKILHEKFRSKKDKDEVLKDQLGMDIIHTILIT